MVDQESDADKGKFEVEEQSSSILVLFLTFSYNETQDASAKDAAKLIYETALLESGFALDKPKDFASRLYDVIKKDLGVEAGTFEGVEEEDEPEEPAKEAEQEVAPEDAEEVLDTDEDQSGKLEKDEL